VTVIVNGAPRRLAPEATVADAVAAVGRTGDGRGVAVAVNGEVVPRSEWSATRLGEGDRVEVLTAVGGG
jgi:sulfur carrier protein